MVTGPTVFPTSQSAGGRACCGTWRSGNLWCRSAYNIGGLALALFLLIPNGVAETIRITTWNLEPPTVAGTTGTGAGANETRVQEAAATLKELNPDVILLQQVRDGKMCEELAQALKPAEYSVLVCSSFREARTGTLSKQQVAILARRKAYFSSSEAWRTEGHAALPGGLAFAALQMGEQRVGVFSVQAGAGLADAGGSGQSAARQVAQVASAGQLSEQVGAVLPGGLGFAALQMGRQRDGALSVQAGAGSADAGGSGQSAARQAAQAASVGQLLEQVRSVTSWATNRAQVLVVAGTFDPVAEERFAGQDTPLRLLEGAGFGDAFLAAPAAVRTTRPGKAGQPGGTADYIFTQPAGCATNPRILSAAVSAHYPVTCDVELGQLVVATAQASRVAAMPAREPQSSKPQPPTAAAASLKSIPTALAQALNRHTGTAAGLAGFVTLAALVWLLVRRRRALPLSTPALSAVGGESNGTLPSSYTVVVGTWSATEPAPANTRASSAPRPIIHIETPGATQTQAEALRRRAWAAEQRAERATAVIRSGLLPYLRHWLKQKLVRKLIADRAQLLATQHAATLKVLDVEGRLTRIEQQIQRQNYAYQERIEALTRELITTREENRELIRARIAQVKAEMEAARVRMMAQAEADDERGA